ncbi:C-type lectin domain family 4 member E-like [Larimichthys crocea]|uniref:C-type lectin domain family 4 member E-like n=1 Tax=Larimichthys crocea TaxID=215358 RepID=UPI000F5E5F73|nr:C-type lectin domain family 4 member E-like [Larimichthys crocea]
MNNNLTNEREKLKSVIDTKCCPDQWNKVGNSCYFTSTSQETWYDSKRVCEKDNAHLVIISSKEEQKYLTTFGLRIWIGLTDEETEEDWKWVNGEPVTKPFWRDNQPDNYQRNEHCAELAGRSGNSLKNWNDLDCKRKLHFTCEKVLP